MIKSFILVFGILLTFIANAQPSEEIDTSHFRIAYNESWPPYSAGKGDQVEGLIVTLLEEIITTKLGIPVLSYGFPWKRAQAEVQMGRFDAFITVPTDERLKYTISSQNIIFKIKMVAVMKSNSINAIRLLSDTQEKQLNQYKICDTLGNGWGKNFYQKLGINVTLTNDIDACLRMIKADRIDLSIQSERSLNTNDYLNSNRQNFVILPEAFGVMSFTLMLSKNSQFGEAFIEKFDNTF